MEDNEPTDLEQSESEIDPFSLYVDRNHEELLAAAEAEWDKTDPEDRPYYAAMAAMAAARLGQRDAGIEWLARAPAGDTTRLDHLLLAEANVLLGRIEEARQHRSASMTAPPPPADTADVTDGLEVAVAARLREDLGTLSPLSADRLASADTRDWSPDRFAANWLFLDKDWEATLAVGEWAATAGRPWAAEPDFWLGMATSAAGSLRPDLVVRALNGRTGSWPSALAQRADVLMARAFYTLGDPTPATEVARRAAGIDGPMQRDARFLARLYACDPTDLHCQFDAIEAWWQLVTADAEPDADERIAAGATLLRTGTNDSELGRRALDLVGPVAPPDLLAPLAELTLAFVALAEQRYEAALSHLDAADLPDGHVGDRHGALIGRARALIELDRPGEALEASLEARALRAEFGLGIGLPQPILPLDLQILERAGRWSDLADAARTAVASDIPQDQLRTARGALVVALLELGDLEGAVAEGRSLVDMPDEADVDLAARIGVASVCQTRGKLDDATALLGDDVPEASNRLRVRRWMLCFAIGEGQGNVEAAIAALRAAAPLDADAAQLLSYYLAIFRPDDSEAPTLESLTDPGDEPTPLGLLIAANARATLNQEGAEELLARAVKLEPAVANWMLYRTTAATMAANRGDEEAVRRLLAGQDERLVARLLAAAAGNAPDHGSPEGRRRQLGYLDSVVADARPDVDLDRLGLVSAHALRGAVLAQAGDMVAAKEAVAQARAARRADDPPLIRVQPEFVDAVLAVTEGAWPRVVATIEALVLDGLPGTVVAATHEMRGIADCALGELESARKALRTAVATKPDRVFLLLLGQVELALEDPENAREMLQRAAQDSSEGDAEVLALLSQAERLLHHDTAAIERAREAIAVDDQSATARLALGSALNNAGRWEPALRAFEQGLRLNPTPRIRQQLWLKRLVVLAHLDRYAQVVTEASSPAELDEESEALLAQCHAGALDRLGRRSDAVAVLRRAEGNPHLSSAMRRVLVQADETQVRRDSWLGFWFGPVASGARKAVGAALLTIGAVIALGLAMNPERVGWLSWRATGAEAALSLVIVAVLFLIPLATNLKMAGVEIAVPAAPEPVLDPIDPVDISRVLDAAVVNVFSSANPPSVGQAANTAVAATDPIAEAARAVDVVNVLGSANPPSVGQAAYTTVAATDPIAEPPAP